MTFNDEDFTDFLNFCKNSNSFHKKAKKSYDYITNISKSNNNTSFINNTFSMFNFDNLCFNANLRSNEKPKRNLPASCDAMYFKKETCELYFIEFKNLPLNSTDYKKELKNIIKQFELKENIDNNTIHMLKKIYQRFEDEIICQLKVKTVESVFYSLPLVYEYYCEKLGLNFNQQYSDFMTWLLNSQKLFIVVFADSDINPSNIHLSFEAKLKDKLNYFNSINNTKAIILTKTEFENEILYKHFKTA